MHPCTPDAGVMVITGEQVGDPRERGRARPDEVLEGRLRGGSRAAYHLMFLTTDKTLAGRRPDGTPPDIDR
jgi:hypothetical protein